MKPLNANSIGDTAEYHRLLLRQDAERQREEELLRQRRADLGSRSVQELQALLQAMVKEELVTFLGDPEYHVRALIQAEFKKVVLTLIGIDSSWSDYRIASNSPVANELGRHILAQIQLALPDLIKEFIPPTEVREQVTKALHAEFQSKFRYKVNDQLNEWLTEEAKRTAGDIIEKIKKANSR